MGFHDLPHSHGDSHLGHRIQAFEPALAKLLTPASLVKFHQDKGLFGLKISRRVVKSQVPVFADTDAGQVNGIRGYDLSDPLAFILCVRRIAIHKMHYARVNPVHQAFFQIAPETGRMLLAEAQIFIQMVHGGLGPIYAGLAGQ
jgi:hypothetical protein